MNNMEIVNHFEPLWDDINPADEFYNSKPFLAHYTSLAAAHEILKHDEIWLSNPMLMNDHEEVRFGIDAGLHVITTNEALSKALASQERATRFRAAFGHFRAEFARVELADTFVFSWSRHDPEDVDGILSMWRGYGGSGSGVAMVMDSSQISVNTRSPFTLAKVDYGTGAQRHAWLNTLVSKFADLLATIQLADDQLHIPAWCLFKRIRSFALFSKHIGFAEENEWRMVYWRDRDPEKLLSSMIGYHISPRGIEPKLKLKIGQIPGITVAEDFSISKITSRIILGPTVSSHLAVTATKRMLAALGKSELCERVVASSIPFRER